MHFKRHELKYYINDIQMEGLIIKLSNLMELDDHSDGLNGYKVRSLYFDSINDECLFQKQSGFLVRNKIRLRTYGDPNASNAKLEVKKKYDQLINKDSILIPRDLAIKLNNGLYSPLLDLENPISNWIYTTFSTKLYQPKVIVEYQRLAFVLPVSNVRITFDMNLSSNINHTDLFSNVKDLMPVFQEGKQIMEVKFNQFLPEYLRKVLSSVAVERAAISKYTLARRFHKIHKWEDN